MINSTTTNGNKRKLQAPDLAMLLSEQETVRLTELTADQLESMRPALAIFLGGSGHLTGLYLKAGLMARFGEAWRQKIRILAFDTAEEPFALQLGQRLVRLEPGAEFFNIGNVPVPNIIRNIDNLESIRARLGAVLGRLPATALRNGAKSIPPLGLMAFLWHYATIFDQLRRALWSLAGRDQQGAEVAQRQQGINVFISGSLAGGTGSGLVVDVAYLVRSLFNELGTQGEFCHVTNVAFLPQAFQGVPVTNLYANTAASLQEYNHLMTRGNFSARYPDGRRVHVQEAPFNTCYVLDGVDERGLTWAGISDVAAMAAEGIYLQMASQMGRKGENVFDNLDHVLSGRTADGEGTFLASFGLGYLEFPAPAVAELCARWFLEETIEQAWLSDPGGETANAGAHDQLRPVAPDQVAPTLLRDPESGSQLRLDLRQPRWLQNKPHDEVVGEAAAYVREYGHSRVNERLLGRVEQNELALGAEQKETWSGWVNDRLFAPGFSLLHLLAALRHAQAQLSGWMDDNRRELKRLGVEQEQRQVAVNEAETALARAAASIFVGRARRIGDALDGCFQAAEELYEVQVQAGLRRAQQKVWSELAAHLAHLERQVQALADRLETIVAQMRSAAAEQLKAVQDSGVSRLSLADEAYVRALYREHAPERGAAAVNLPAMMEVNAPLTLADLSTKELSARLLAAFERLFDQVRRLSVETVIRNRADEMSARARRQQLFQLATPSWSVDRARLPEGGNGLKRIEVMGVPDASDTLFGEETTLVSTHDPLRLVAFVVVAGAPQSALQLHDRFQQVLEQVRHQRPVYVLPHFMADASQARLAFALASIFGFIYNQGTYFYYQPGDELESPARLGNGLANAIAFLETDEALVREIMERVDGQVARLGLQRAIQVLADYYDVPPERRAALDDLTRELKQLVREYAEELRQINDFSSGLKG